MKKSSKNDDIKEKSSKKDMFFEQMTRMVICF